MVLCVCVMATNFLELATTLKYLGAKWLPGKKVNFMPCSLPVPLSLSIVVILLNNAWRWKVQMLCIKNTSPNSVMQDRKSNSTRSKYHCFQLWLQTLPNWVSVANTSILTSDVHTDSDQNFYFHFWRYWYFFERWITPNHLKNISIETAVQ